MKTILVYGDSLSWGIIPGSRQRLPFERRWPGVLQQAVSPDALVVEACLNGRTTVWDDPFRPGRNGRDWLIPALESHAPLHLVILFLGTNDLQTVHGMGAFEAALGVATLVDAIRARVGDAQPTPPEVLLVAPPPVGKPAGAMADKFAGAPPRSVDFARHYRNVAQERGVRFFDAGRHVSASPVDGVHLDAEAHYQLGCHIAPVVADMLKRIKP